uniref:Nuclear receptor corepressor 1 n=1 Tax=Triticum urartu TaxID=4572 RepID=A0A8R7JZ18_TRIUA
MPPPPPDRREFLYRDGRRHDVAAGDPLLPAPPATPRWRDSPYHPPPPPPPLRDHARPSPRRTASSASSEGYYRQGAGAYDRSYPDEPLGYTPSRSDRYWLEEDPPAGYKGFSRYGGGGGRRDGRDLRGSYRRSPFRSYGGDFPRGHQEPPPPPPLRRSPLRSVAVPICYDPPSDRADREDREHQPRATPWRPLRRRESRSDATDAAGAGPLSARQSATAGAASEKNAPSQSAAVADSQSAEEETPRKKPRLGWGQGLAKYEKQKVPGSSESAEPVAEGSPGGVEQKEVDGAPAPALCASPVAAPAAPPPAPALCASPVAAPAAPSAPPSCSPVPEDKSCELTTNTVTVSNKDIPGAEVQAYNDEIPIKLGQLDGDRIGSLANVLAELLQHEDSCSGDSRRLTNSSKLLLLKENIARELEKTELEIDSLECELKSVSTESENKALEDAQNPSPSSGTSKTLAKPATSKVLAKPETSKVLAMPEICGTSSSPKEQGVLTPCKLSVGQEADANGVDLMDVVTAPVRSVTAVSSGESVACPGVVAEAQVAVAADVAPLKPSEGTGSEIDAHCLTPEPGLSHDNVSSMKADGSNALSTRQCSHHIDSHNLIPSIIAVNNDIAKEFNELVFKPLPAGQPCLGLSSEMKNDLSVRKKLGIHKNRLRFKEQALTFKFKVLRHLWKEDVRLLSVRKQRPKSNKRTDQSNRASQSGSQRQRSSNRSRLGMPAGNLSTFPTTEISDVANKMFTEFQFKRCRNYLKMPALIIDEKEKESASFVSKNGLIEDPVSVEKERSVINPWTHEEKEVFMQMLASFGKNFSKISNFLQHKTTADCVEFYYKHHKSDSFREVKKLLDLRQQQPTGNYLGTKSGKKWNPENAASLDMLGNAASVVAAHGLDYANRVEKDTAKSIIRTSCRSDVSAVAKGSLDKDGIANVSLHERESVAADVLAGICGTLSPEGMGSCITSSADHGQKIGATRMEYLIATPEADKSFDEEDDLSDQECEVDSVDWNDNEKSLFIEALNNHGKDFARISSYVKSKSYEQCKVFFSKARISLGLDLIYQQTTDAGLPTGDASGGRSDTDEACAAEMDSPICSTQSPVEMEMEVCPSVDKTLQGHLLSGIAFKQSETDRSDGPDIVDLTFEEGEIKAEDTNNCNIPVDHRQSSEATHESTPSCAPIDINSSESTGSMENREHSNQVSAHGNGAMASSTELPVGAHLEISTSLHNVEVIEPSKVSEMICTQVSSIEGPSKHAPESAHVKAGNSTPSVCLPGESGSKENVTHFSDMAGVSCIRPAFTSSYQQSVPTDLLPAKPKSQVTPLTPKDLMPVQFSSDLPDPTSIRFEGIASITSPNFGDHANRVSNTPGPKDMNKFPVFNEQSRSQHDVLFRNIDGYLQHRRNHHLAVDIPAFSDSTVSGSVGISHPDQFTITKYQNGRSGSSGLSSTSAGFLMNGSSKELREGQLKPCSHKASTESCDQVKRPGDVKLFGKILSHQSSLQSSGSSSNVTRSKPPPPTTAAGLLGSGMDRMVYSSRPTNTAHFGQDERVVRSYTHLDGSTAQPESSLFRVAKCQRSSMASVPFYSAKNGSLGVFGEYQQPLRQQLPSDPKRLESYADLQKRNGIELISGFQQQQPGKAARLGGAGILVSPVSDPVAALKAQYGSSSKFLGKDADHPWKDIGNR